MEQAMNRAGTTLFVGAALIVWWWGWAVLAVVLGLLAWFALLAFLTDRLAAWLDRR
jgi:predicted PurR-regulated permease PerM